MLIIAILITVFLTGCATQVSHFRLDMSLQKDVRAISGSEYISLAKVCDFYSLDYKYDNFARTGSIRKGSNRIVVRDEGDRALIDGEMVKIEKPATVSGGTL